MNWIFLPLAIVAIVLFYNAAVSFALKRSVGRTQCDETTGIAKGAEPVYLEGRSGKAALLIHGYIGSPTDYGILAQKLHAAGYTVSVPLLPGHGRRDPREFDQTSGDELVRIAEVQYRELKKTHKQVALVGFSMGGAIATLAAAKLRPDFMILIAPYYGIAHRWFYGVPAELYHALLLPFIPHLYRLRCFKQIKSRTTVTPMCDYSYISMKGTSVVIKLSRKAKKAFPDLPPMPVLIVASSHDQAVDYRIIRKFAALPGKAVKFVAVENSNHILLQDNDHEIVEREILDFLGRTLA